MRKIKLLSIVLSLLVVGSAVYAAAPAATQPEELNIYSYRKENLIKPLLDTFTQKTGVKINLISGEAPALFERLKAEREDSKADILMTADTVSMIRASEAGMLAQVHSKILDEAIPAQFRDPKGEWYGFSLRSRVIFYDKTKIKAAQLSTYEDLADPKWKGKICMRSSSSSYNQSLLAWMIQRHGRDEAKKWAQGIVDNLARKPQGEDIDQLKALATGQCEIAVANTYYYGLMLNAPNADTRDMAKKITLFWPNQKDAQKDGGAHINIAGGGILKWSAHRETAQKFLEFVASDEGQKYFTEHTYEFPVKKGVPLSKTTAGFGKFKESSLPLANLAPSYTEAMKIFDEVGWK